jgi:O-antigen ligase
MKPAEAKTAPLAWLAGALALIGLPVAMTLSNRSSPLMLGLAASVLASALLLEVVRGARPGLWQTFARFVRRPFVWLIFLLAILALAGIPRTQHPAFHAWRWGEAMLPILAMMAVLALIPVKRMRVTFGLVAAGIALAALLLLVDLLADAPLRQWLGLRDESWRLNRAMVTITMMLPLLAALATNLRERAIALLVAMLVLLTISRSDSGASLLAYVAMLGVGLIAILAFRLAWILTGIGTLTALMTAPFHGLMLDAAIPEGWHQSLRSVSSAIRISIYRTYDAAVAYAPWFGSGFNTGARYRDEPGYALIPPDLQRYVEFGHPHNAALQVWLELGFAGAALMMILIVLVLRAILALNRAIRPYALAFFASVVAISLVSHGAWQAWWLALIGLGAVVFATREAELSRDRQSGG